MHGARRRARAKRSGGRRRRCARRMRRRSGRLDDRSFAAAPGAKTHRGRRRKKFTQRCGAKRQKNSNASRYLQRRRRRLSLPERRRARLAALSTGRSTPRGWRTAKRTAASSGATLNLRAANEKKKPRDDNAPPLDGVLRLLLDEADTLEHVRNVVDAPLLRFENSRRLVQVDDVVWRLVQQIEETRRQQRQAVLGARQLVVAAVGVVRVYRSRRTPRSAASEPQTDGR